MKKNQVWKKLITGALCMSMLAACTSKKAEETTSAPSSEAKSTEQTSTAAEISTEAADDGKINVVSTIFPSYDWVREVVGDKAERFEFTLLLDKGMDLHSYQPSAEDIAKIAKCDLFIYVGGESDTWVADALKEATNKDMKVINLLEEVGDAAKEEEVKEGMQAHDHDHDHEHEGEDHEHESGEHADDHDHEHESGAHADDHDHEHESGEHADDHDHEHESGEHADDHDHEGDDHDHSHEHVYDEHVWLSLKNAQVLVNEIASDIQEIDPENAKAYQENAKIYTDELMGLDGAYKAAVDSAAVKTVLFGDRFPFRYLVDDYGLDYYAAFVGCSAETEASFDTVTFLAKKVDELSLKTIFTIENSDQKIANTIKENTASKDQNIVVLDSLQSVSKEDIAAGESYLGVMTENLAVLQEALQ